MNLSKKKALAAETLGVGKGRIIFNTARLDEIKEALTKQDIRDLYVAGAISIREIIGSKKVVPKENRRRAGSIKKKVNKSKEVYMAITRKLRRYIKELLSHEKITKLQYLKLRQEIRAHSFKSKAHLKERLVNLE
ncbi:MAG: 50S ribosomal protein L19e [Nanoarchaeota archaeon]